MLVVVAAAAAALLAGRVLITVVRGEVTRRRGFQHERVAEVEPGLRRPLWLALVAAVVAVVVGLPGLQSFSLGSRRVAGLTFTRFVFYGDHHQQIDFNGVALLIALLTLACGVGVAVYLLFAGTACGSPRRVDAGADSRAWPLRRVAHRRGDAAVARGRIAVSRASMIRSPRRSRSRWGRASTSPRPGSASSATRGSARYLAGGIVVIAVLALLSVLAATGHLWVHTA